MTLPIYQVDAFSIGPFTGNPAAVVPLDEWLSDDLLQAIAMENNLSETAYFVSAGDNYQIRWFTPTIEVALCGHATLASAKVLFDEMGYPSDTITFESKSGPLYVSQHEGRIVLDFPQDVIRQTDEYQSAVEEALGAKIEEMYIGKSDYMCVLQDEHSIRSLSPDFHKLRSIDCRGLLVTSVADEHRDYHVISRCFYPQSGIDEDPVTGSAHTTIVPYWAHRLNRTTIEAYQASHRGGRLSCEIVADRIRLAGNAELYMTGEIIV